MQKQILKFIFTLAIFFMLPSFVWATPAITSTSGIISDGQSVTINGTGFGVKVIAAPLHFDDFAEGVVGDSIGQHSTYWNDPTSVSNRMHYSADFVRAAGHKSGKAASDKAQTQSGQILKNNVGFASTGKIYLNYWTRFDWGTSSGHYWQLKTLALVGSLDGNGNVTDYPGLAIFNYKYDAPDYTPVTMSYLSNYWDGSGSGPQLNFEYLGNNYDLMNDVGWYNVIVQVDMGTLGTANGSSTIWLSDDTFNRPYGVNSQSNVMILGNASNANKIDAIKVWLYQGDTATVGGTAIQYFDSIYIDNSWARIELCNTDTWSTRTHCEIQKPTAWSDTENTVTINQGSFAGGSSAYLFVVDENGSVNSDGYSVTLAAQSDTTAPSAPSGLSVL